MSTLTQTKFSLSEIRNLFNRIDKDSTLLKELLKSNYLDNDSDIKKLIKSLKDCTINTKAFLNEEIIYDDSNFYDYNDYTITREGDIVYTDDANFCEFYQEYTSENVYCVYIGRNERYYCQEAIDDEGLHRYNGEYYDTDALSRYDLVVLENGDICSIDEAYYNEEEGTWHDEPIEQYVRDYHSNTNVKFVEFTEAPKFYIGFEIEKEDKEVKESILINDFERKCDKWRKERDGSLNDSSGFEMISPCFELNTEEIKKNIEANEILMQHINCKIDTDTCGGHINISEAGLSGEQLFNKIEGYTPLFHALYYKRIDKNWSKGKSNNDLKNDKEKYQSIRIHSNRLEYRIISAVPNFDTLIWRTKLFEIILNNQTSCPKVAFYNIQTILKEHLGIMYKNERFNKLIERIIEFTQKYEGIILSKGANEQTEQK